MEFCISMDFSGVSSIIEPSCGDLNLTPSSVIWASSSNETIWKPPLSWWIINRTAGVPGLAPKWVRLAPSGTNLRHHQWKLSEFVPFGSKSDILVFDQGKNLGQNFKLNCRFYRVNPLQIVVSLGLILSLFIFLISWACVLTVSSGWGQLGLRHQNSS